MRMITIFAKGNQGHFGNPRFLKTPDTPVSRLGTEGLKPRANPRPSVHLFHRTPGNQFNPIPPPIAHVHSESRTTTHRSTVHEFH